MREDIETRCSQIACYLLNAEYQWFRWESEFLRYMVLNPPRNPSESQMERLRNLAKRLLNERQKSDNGTGESRGTARRRP